jgi:hypothetical protein
MTSLPSVYSIIKQLLVKELKEWCGILATDTLKNGIFISTDVSKEPDYYADSEYTIFIKCYQSKDTSLRKFLDLPKMRETAPKSQEIKWKSILRLNVLENPTVEVSSCHLQKYGIFYFLPEDRDFFQGSSHQTFPRRRGFSSQFKKIVFSKNEKKIRDNLQMKVR